MRMNLTMLVLASGLSAIAAGCGRETDPRDVLPRQPPRTGAGGAGSRLWACGESDSLLRSRLGAAAALAERPAGADSLGVIATQYSARASGDASEWRPCIEPFLYAVRRLGAADSPMVPVVLASLMGTAIRRGSVQPSAIVPERWRFLPTPLKSWIVQALALAHTAAADSVLLALAHSEVGSLRAVFSDSMAADAPSNLELTIETGTFVSIARALAEHGNRVALSGIARDTGRPPMLQRYVTRVLRGACYNAEPRRGGVACY